MQIGENLLGPLSYAQLAVSNYNAKGPITILDPQDDMRHPTWDTDDEHYFAAGREALEIILECMVLTETRYVSTILDMPCGFGRVARHLRTAFPQASLICSDLYGDRVEFCQRTFDAIGIKSKEDFEEMEFPQYADLIWVGSLLSHMPEPLFKKAIRLLSRSLNPNGIAIFTTQGRHAPYIQKNLWKFIDDDKFARIEHGFVEGGFGFADYENKEQFHEQDAYGITLASPSFIMKCLEEDRSIRIQALLERRWDKCQDVVVFKKAGVHAPD